MAYWPVAARQISRALVGFIRLYQLALSPLLPPSCRFSPTCSAFAAAAIERHGPIRGMRLAVTRLLRCHPWSAGGYDPVPPARGPLDPSATP